MSILDIAFGLVITILSLVGIISLIDFLLRGIFYKHKRVCNLFAWIRPKEIDNTEAKCQANK